ncbi:MAG: TonB-dependent receptor plug domain-containing protein [Steroidobacteraceae bacterium]
MHKSGMRSLVTGLSSASLALAVSQVLAQEAPEKRQIELEEITVTGSQIRGAVISEALPVSIVGSETIEAFGIDSGDQLLDMIPENGNNFFNEAANISGGVNSARGDVGAFNLRSLGTGNTLVLLNGRRVVNMATFQTEEIGGSFVPVNSANANAIPIYGVDRLEVLREGATAIYGADAVAGVFNTVLKKDFQGLNVGLRYTDYDNFPRNNQTVYVEFGQDFNEGRTNLGVFASYFDRDRISAQDDPRWADSDFRYRVPAGSRWFGDSAFNNDSANSIYPQFDVVRTVSTSWGMRNVFTDNAGEFEIYPLGDPRCQYTINQYTCGAVDGQGTFRYNNSETRDVRSALERANVFVYLNHDFGNGVEGFSELAYYSSKTNLQRHASSPFTTSKLRVAADNYWNPFGPCGSPNRLPAELIPNVPCEGLALEIDNIRFSEFPRIVENDGESLRLLQGFRGSWGEWDWESAVLWHRAESDDITRNRVSNSLMQEALDDPTPAAYNPFSGGVDNNIERALVDVYRLSETELTLFDVKFSNNDLLSLPAGPMGVLAGYEFRRESFKDDRDPRLDGTITWVDFEGDTYPFVSDVVNSSPTPDNKGARNVNSLFVELSVPLLENLDLQAAVRYEDFSDVGDATVSKLSIGWRPFEPLLLRAAWSEGFRVPNLVTVNEEIVARVNTRDDYLCLYAAENGGDPDQDTLDCRNSTVRVAQGSQDLRPEKSDNYSVGLVLTPTDNLTFSLDFWEIEKNDTIGLLGEENQTLVELLLQLQNTGDCSSLQGNPAVVRDPNVGAGEAAIYEAAGLCPVGAIEFIDDRYENLDTRTVRGFDVSFDYSLRTLLGRFSLRYAGSFLEEYRQEPGGLAADLVAAQAAGVIPASYPVVGFANLLRRDGNPRSRENFTLGWRKGDWGATFSGFRVGSVYESSLTLPDGTRYTLPSMTTYNASLDYRFEVAGSDARVRFGVVNLTNERAPLTDDYFGYMSDVHSDYGRSYYLDVKVGFGL